VNISFATMKSIKKYIVYNFKGDSVLLRIEFNIYNAPNISAPPVPKLLRFAFIFSNTYYIILYPFLVI